MCTKFWSESLKGRNHSQDIGVDGYYIIMDLKEIGFEIFDRIHRAQNRDQWRAVVNTVTKFRFPLKPGILVTLACQEGLCCTELVS